MTDAPLKAGALFAGYGGIELALDAVLGTRLEWVAEVDPGPSRILAHHWPDVPNLGDVTAVDWHNVEPVDVIAGGSPCQDLSHAGKRQGMKAGTRSGLWASMCDAIEIIRPRLVVWENVRGAYSAAADSAVEPCPFCVGDEPGVTLRALGRVLGDLAELGYDARWYGLRAADVGAPHGRFRVFVFATPADSDVSGLEGLAGAKGTPPAGRHGHSEPRPVGSPLTLLPTPTTSDTNGPGVHGDGGNDLRTTVALLPTPRATDGTKGGRWSIYGPAVARWEAITRPAPDPTEPGTKGAPRLSPRFVEWMMGLPDGWVTDPAIWHGLTNAKGRTLTGTQLANAARNHQLKALGNGVVWQQCAAALARFLADERAWREAVAS